MNYSSEEVNCGVGFFTRAMRCQDDIKGFGQRMSESAIIGVISAAMRSGLPARLVERLPQFVFSSDAILIERVLARYEGDDWSNDLWHRLPNGRYKVCTALCRAVKPGWRYDDAMND